MRRVTAVGAAALTAVLLLAVPSAPAKPPALTTVKVLNKPGQRAGRIYAAWTLSPGIDSVQVEVATKPTRNADGTFLFRNQVDGDFFEGPRRSWQSTLLETGTYYFHVGAEDFDTESEQSTEWSATRKVKIMGSPIRGGTYVGKTSQGYEIRIVTDRRRTVVRKLETTAVARCAGRSKQYVIRGGGRSIDAASGEFSASLRDPKISIPGGIGSISGRFVGSSKVTGRISVLYFGPTPVGVNCYTTKLGFSAGRSG